MNMILDPDLIEDKSFKIISRLLPYVKFPYAEKEVLKRVIHATTDLDYVKDLSFHPRAVNVALKAIKEGKDIVCDVSMVKAGVNKKILSRFGGKIICLINDEDVIRKSAKLKTSRAILSMRKASRFMNAGIVVIGNAPTALFALCDLIKKSKAKPALIIGVPVGFVGAVESKKGLTALGVPYITNRSGKGGSSVAVAIMNALLKLAKEE